MSDAESAFPPRPRWRDRFEAARPDWTAAKLLPIHEYRFPPGRPATVLVVGTASGHVYLGLDGQGVLMGVVEIPDGNNPQD